MMRMRDKERPPQFAPPKSEDATYQRLSLEIVPRGRRGNRRWCHHERLAPFMPVGNVRCRALVTHPGER